jgi:hypothetical protein
MEEEWLHHRIGLFYQIFWLLPVIGTSYYLNVGIEHDKLLTDQRYRAPGVQQSLNGHIDYNMGTAPSQLQHQSLIPAF